MCLFELKILKFIYLRLIFAVWFTQSWTKIDINTCHSLTLFWHLNSNNRQSFCWAWFKFIKLKWSRSSCNHQEWGYLLFISVCQGGLLHRSIVPCWLRLLRHHTLLILSLHHKQLCVSCGSHNIHPTCLRPSAVMASEVMLEIPGLIKYWAAPTNSALEHMIIIASQRIHNSHDCVPFTWHSI